MSADERQVTELGETMKGCVGCLLSIVRALVAFAAGMLAYHWLVK